MGRPRLLAPAFVACASLSSSLSSSTAAAATAAAFQFPPKTANYLRADHDGIICGGGDRCRPQQRRGAATTARLGERRSGCKMPPGRRSIAVDTRLHCAQCPPGFLGPSSLHRTRGPQSLRYMSSSTDDSSSSSSSSSTDIIAVVADNRITTEDVEYMTLATKHARIGFGNTYPNPAVGCVLVRSFASEETGGEEETTIIGQGFHPRAGLPHAEVFALFEACGHVDSGVEAARACVETEENDEEEGGSGSSSNIMERTVLNLLDIYSSDGGPTKLFGGAFAPNMKDDSSSSTTTTVTAYVTLEPCCHYGRTPPCAKSLLEAGVDRVVVGFRDPNPRVDGGGVSMLRDAGVRVDLLGKGTTTASSSASSSASTSSSDSAAKKGELLAKGEKDAAEECADVVRCFAKRIAPRRPNGPVDYDETMTGAKRRALRALAQRKKSDGTLKVIPWPSDGPSVGDTKGEDADALERKVQSLPLDHRWLEEVDRCLWEDELVQLKLTSAVAKKRGVKVLGGRIADELDAHVAQVVGHTALCYRPGAPPVLDLDEI